MIINDQRLFEGFNQGHFWPLKHAKGQKKRLKILQQSFFFLLTSFLRKCLFNKVSFYLKETTVDFFLHYSPEWATRLAKFWGSEELAAKHADSKSLQRNRVLFPLPPLISHIFSKILWMLGKKYEILIIFLRKKYKIDLFFPLFSFLFT